MTRIARHDDSAEVRHVTWVGLGWNVVLSVGKGLAGFFGGSQALIADAIHSASDFMTDIAVIVGSRFWNSPPDADHPYGHRRFETLISVGIGVAVCAVGVGLGYDAIQTLRQGEEGASHPEWIAAVMALLSIVIKECLFRYTVREGKRIRSQALEANAWHHRSDAFSSIGTALGIGGAILLGNDWAVLDAVCAVVVSIMIVITAMRLLRQASGELLEESLPKSTEDKIVDIVQHDPLVHDIHHLHTRQIGSIIAIEMHFRLPGDITLEESHHHASEIERQLREAFGEQTHIMLHVEPIK